MTGEPWSAASFASVMPVDEDGRRRDPPEPQPRRERLARRARVDDPLGPQPLERADRLPVVPELGVVVVLDDPARSPVGPVDERGPAIGRQHATGRVLVRGRDEHRVDVRGVQPVDEDPRVVDRDRDDRQPALDDRAAVLGVRRVLDGHPPGATRAASARAISPRPWMNPVDTTTVSGATAIPRTRLR